MKLNLVEILEEMDEILTSGNGGFGNFHREELTKLIEPLTSKQKQKMFKEYEKQISEFDNVDIDSDEVDFIRDLC